MIDTGRSKAPSTTLMTDDTTDDAKQLHTNDIPDAFASEADGNLRDVAWLRLMQLNTTL